MSALSQQRRSTRGRGSSDRKSRFRLLSCRPAAWLGGRGSVAATHGSLDNRWLWNSPRSGRTGALRRLSVARSYVLTRTSMSARLLQAPSGYAPCRPLYGLAKYRRVVGRRFVWTVYKQWARLVRKEDRLRRVSPMRTTLALSRWEKQVECSQEGYETPPTKNFSFF